MKKKDKLKRTKYEKQELFNLEVIKWITLADVIINLAFIPYQGGSPGIFCPLQIFICITAVVGYFKCSGLLSQGVTLVPWFIIRVYQGVYHIYFSTPINWVIFGILVVVDIGLLAMQYVDVSTYEYRLK